MGRKETKVEDWERTQNLRGALFDYACDDKNTDKEFTSVMWHSLKDPYLHEVPPGHERPTKS